MRASVLRDRLASAWIRLRGTGLCAQVHAHDHQKENLKTPLTNQKVKDESCKKL